MSSTKTTPGILYVTMQPKDELPLAQFHDWYNNEHGPTRLRLPFVQNGFRYRAKDLFEDGGTGKGSQEKPEWSAIYDISDMNCLTQDEYTRLRQPPVQSQRERDTMKKIHVNRRFYDAIPGAVWTSPEFKKLEEVGHEGEGNILCTMTSTVQKTKENQENIAKWYEEEYLPLVRQIPGWRRVRRFVTSHLEDSNEEPNQTFLCLTEYAPSTSSEQLYHSSEAAFITNGRCRLYDLYYTFGPAPRDLRSLSSADVIAPAEFAEGLTRTVPVSCSSSSTADTKPLPSTHSHITTIPDGTVIPYTLTGSSDPDAPVLLCINSILTTSSIWAAFITHFTNLTDNKYRILTYDSRGRNAPTSTSPVTLETLADDVLRLLDTLRIKKVTVIGVSLGGATAVHLALNHWNRISSFIASDTNAVAPPSNPKAWSERIDMAEAEGAKSKADGQAIVGANLADATVKRWFTPASHGTEAFENVKEMVRSNSLPGFKATVNALYAYDMRAQLPGFAGKGAFLVGAQDGVLPKTMAGMAEELGKECGKGGTRLEVIEGAGHLPMVEKPSEVARFVAEFLEG